MPWIFQRHDSKSGKNIYHWEGNGEPDDDPPEGGRGYIPKESKLACREGQIIMELYKKKKTLPHSSNNLLAIPGGRFIPLPNEGLSPLSQKSVSKTIQETAGSPYTSPSRILTVTYNEANEITGAQTPGGTHFNRVMKTGNLTLLSNESHDTSMSHTSKNWQDSWPMWQQKHDSSEFNSPPFNPLTKFEGEIELTLKVLEKFNNKRRDWGRTQRDVMGNMSAADVAKQLGLPFAGKSSDWKKQWHWMHLLAFSMGGRDGIEPNEPENLVLGTGPANGVHLRLEEVIKRYVRESKSSVLVKYEIDKESMPFSATWHVVSKINYGFYKKEGSYNEEKEEHEEVYVHKESLVIEPLKWICATTKDEETIMAGIKGIEVRNKEKNDEAIHRRVVKAIKEGYVQTKRGGRSKAIEETEEDYIESKQDRAHTI